MSFSLRYNTGLIMISLCHFHSVCGEKCTRNCGLVIKKRRNEVNVIQWNTIPARRRRSSNADLMLAHRLRRWANIKSALDERLVLAGMGSF